MEKREIKLDFFKEEEGQFMNELELKQFISIIYNVLKEYFKDSLETSSFATAISERNSSEILKTYGSVQLHLPSAVSDILSMVNEKIKNKDHLISFLFYNYIREFLENNTVELLMSVLDFDDFLFLRSVTNTRRETPSNDISGIDMDCSACEMRDDCPLHEI